MNAIRRIGIIILFIFAPLCLSAAEAVRSARLVAVSGSLSIAGPDGAAIDATLGAVLPVGSSIETAVGGQATVEFFSGTLAIIQPESSVVIEAHSISVGGEEKENALMDLRVGGIIASLDPAKKAVSNFRVRTPKGIAAARGTVFSVRVSPNRTDGTVSTMSGTVTFVTDQGEITVAFGQVSSGGSAMSVADAVRANPNLANEILEAVSTMGKAVGDGSITNTTGSPNLTSTLLAALVDVAVQAAPDNAPEVLRDLISSAGPALRSSDVQTITAAAVQATERVNPAAVQDVQNAGAVAAIDAGVPPPPVDSNPILPPLDQTQIIVSPSRAP